MWVHANCIILAKCWDVSGHCSVGSQTDVIFKDPAVRKGRDRSDVKNSCLLHSLPCMQLWQQATPEDSDLGLAMYHFHLSLTTAHLVILVLAFSIKIWSRSPILTSFTSCQIGSGPGLSTRLFQTHLSWSAVQSAMLILSLQLVSLLTYRALCGPHHKPQNRTHFTARCTLNLLCYARGPKHS